MFIGRQRELDTLNQLYQSDKFQFAIIYGRRRVGKTALINKFLQDKKSIYFMGVESNAKQNLENLSARIMESMTGVETETVFASFQVALEYVFKCSEKERIVLAIDEYPYIARASESLASTLQMLIDQYKDRSKLMLILCGSSMSYMEDHVLAYKAPLYGRRTAQIKLLPFDFEETCQYLSSMQDEDKALTYSVFGGTPQYLIQCDPQLTVEENIKKTLLNPMSFLYEEPINLLKQEMREPAIYTAVISAIATGASRLSEIANKVGEANSQITSYLKNLIALGIVNKETPYGEKDSRRSIYRIEDSLFRFWYRFVLPNQSSLVRGAGNMIYQRISPHLSDHMGTAFEEICRQYLWKLLIQGQSPIEFSSLGRWWGTDPRTRSQVEIDIVGEESKTKGVVAECKWTNDLVDTAVLDKLVDRSKLFSFSQVHFFLFAKNGFTKGCVQKAGEIGNVTLVTFDEMMRHFNKD